MSESCSSKHPCKAVAPKRLFPRTTLHTCSSQRLPKAAPKVAPKAAVLQSCCEKLLLKAAPQSCSLQCSTKMCPKPFFNAVAAKRFSKAVSPNVRFCKLVYQNGSPKLFCDAAPERWPEICFWKLLPEVGCENATERFCSSKQLNLKFSPDSLPKLLPKAAVQSY